MNIPDEVIEAVTGMHPEQREYPDDVRKDFHAAAEWARAEVLREACAHPTSRVKFDGGRNAVVCDTCSVIVTHLNRTEGGR